MNSHLLTNMALARSAKEQSPHITHKVGVYLRSSSNSSSAYNFWPKLLANNAYPHKKLGNASTTVHAETSSLMQANISTNMADIYITDFPCPNCAKTLSEAGIANVYIDAHSHNPPLGIKMKPYFEQVSMLIFKCAGIGVFEVNIEKKNVSTLLEPHSRNKELSFLGAGRQSIENISKNLFHEQIKAQYKDNNTTFAACIASDKNGNNFILSAYASNAWGLEQKSAKEIAHLQNKYEPELQPFNRILAHCAYYDLKIKDGYYFSSQCPTSREFVNMIGYGLSNITIDDTEQCRDTWGLIALKQIHDYNILQITEAAPILAI